MTLSARVVARYLLQARALNLAEWGLEGILKGQPVTLYHGTTALFHKFDPSTVREELVNKFYGPGIFLVPSKRVAEQYAGANRNIGFPVSIIDDLKHKNPHAGAFLHALYTKGKDAWDDWTPETLGVEPGSDYIAALTKLAGGVDPNTLQDISGYVVGSKITPLGSGDDNPLMNLLHGSRGTPSHVYDLLDEAGLDSKSYRPKVYTVTVTVHNPLVTASSSEARAARHKGYDSVVFFGSDLVGGVPEVAVFDPSHVKVKHVELV